MITSLTYGKDKENIEELIKYIKDMAANIDNDEWEHYVFNSLQALKQGLEDKPLLNMMYYDFSKREELDYLQEIRKSYKEANLMLIVDSKVSPMEYMKPGIMAGSLLLKPWKEAQARDRIKEFISSFYEEFMSEDNQNSYMVETREGRTAIAYSRIYYFEARDKKIYICTGGEEIGFYGTIDALAEQLPDIFLRCHRSFIVNKLKIKNVLLSQNIIELYDYFDVPLSRSYKPQFKGMK